MSERSYHGATSRSLGALNYVYGAMGRQIDPSWGGPIELFLFPASAPRLVQQRP